jgi:hypothetical protein
MSDVSVGYVTTLYSMALVAFNHRDFLPEINFKSVFRFCFIFAFLRMLMDKDLVFV